MTRREQDLLRDLFDVAVDAVQADRRLRPHLPEPAKGNTVVVGAGKAAAAMARVTAEHYGGDTAGLVITRHGHGLGADTIGAIQVIEAGHPIPDAAGYAAASRVLELVSDLGRDDLALCLLSGGGSALLAMPAPGLSLDDKQAVTRALITCGATIDEINCVRKHLSAIKGGRLAVAAHPARVLTLAISDVASDDPSVIASGPTTADPTTFADARALVEKYGIDPPPATSRHLGAAIDEPPKPGDARLARAEFHIVATAKDALAATAKAAADAGFKPVVVGDAIEGEARDVARAHAGLARDYQNRGSHLALLSGGETTVTIRGSGGGGPNTEYALALAMALGGASGISAIACDTDGIDGSEDNAGAMIFSDTLSRAHDLGLDPEAYLMNNDSYGFFASLDDLVVPGPTLTNVNDFRAILVSPG